MLIYVYVFALILGGVLLGSSILLGGHDDGELEAGDADADADLDADADGEVEAHGGSGTHGKELDFGHGGADFFLWTFRSIRFWTFFLAFFGLTGVVLDGLGMLDHWAATLALSIGMGAVTGMGASGVIRYLSTDTTGVAAGSEDYVGKTVRVLVPVSPSATGKVRLQLKGNTVDVLATCDDDNFASKEEAIIIEMEGTTARIARVDPRH